MADIVWEDPPASTVGRPGFDYDGLVAELKKHSGKWAVARTGGKHTGSFSSARERLMHRGCEAVQRKQPDGTYTLYARWPET